MNTLSDEGIIRMTATTPEPPELTSSGTKTALNFVLAWDPQAAGVVILLPTIISLILCVTWPIVAVLKYEADVQTSVQTATSLASYIVTAGK